MLHHIDLAVGFTEGFDAASFRRDTRTIYMQELARFG